MLWANEWKAISVRIDMLIEIGKWLKEDLQTDRQDQYGSIIRFTNQMNDAHASIVKFCNNYKTTLPEALKITLQNYIKEGDVHEFAMNNGRDDKLPVVVACLMRFCMLLAEMKYHLSNTSEVIKRQSERAFLHLQQSIVAADDIQQRWEKAFTLGETACEKLGAAHLLQFGIFAFKAHAPGARTDLVFPDRPLNIDAVQRTADGLVLTEWKKVNNKKDAATIAAHARQQSALYNSGILGGIELATYRFIVLVSEKQLDDITDEEQDGVIYRHINIAVKPESPSVAALN